MMSTRNFRVRNEVVERGSVTKSQKGKKPYVERKVGECFQWKAHGQCSKAKETRAVSAVTQWPLVTVTKGQRPRGRSSSPHQIRRQRPTVKMVTNLKVLTREVRLYAFSKIVKNRPVNFGIFPCVRITGHQKDACMGNNAIFDRLRERKSQQQVKERWCERISCIIEGVYTIGVFCVSREQGRLGSKHAVTFSNGTWHQIKIRDRKGPSRGIIQKVCTSCA